MRSGVRIPSTTGVHDGLAYTLWVPDEEPLGGVVIIHGAGSCKENHHDFARAACGWGLAAVCFDQRGHGESEGALDGRLVDDVVSIAGLLPAGPIALRGSSLGGFLALAAAARARAAAVVAICPAPGELLLRGLRGAAYEFDADRETLEPAIGAIDLEQVVAQLDVPLLLLHAEGDEQVPADHSRALAAAARPGRARLLVLPGGHHRSIQHDPELQGESLRFLSKALRAAA